MDGSAEGACFVLGVSLYYADTFFSTWSFLWCSYGPKLFTVDSMFCVFVPLCDHEPIVTSDGTFGFRGLQFFRPPSATRPETEPIQGSGRLVSRQNSKCA